ncbi:MAG: hypothetical protein PHU14_08075 [Methylovulum sp.]|nr:hypothetical protein [Methylovulum sp.]
MSAQVFYPGLYPGVIQAYDAAARQVRVSIDGITEGGDELPIAELKYPLGDKAKNTEIEILVGDTVWVNFLGGDARYPIIDSYRNPQAGNSTGLRYFHHAGITLSADETLTLSAKHIVINGSESIKLTGATDINGNVTTEGTLKNNSINVGSTLKHTDPQGGTTGTPH